MLNNGITAYTDGSCKGPKDEGGYWFVVLDSAENIIHEAGGYSKSTTAQEMEIRALADLIEWCGENIEHRQSIKIYSDSKYGVNGFSSWCKGWAKNDWKNSRKETVAHVDDWKRIWGSMRKQEFHVKHVKAHNGNFWNEYCDKKCGDVWRNKQEN